MSRNEGISGGTLMLAFLAGSITGACVALLFAPAPGDETRNYLSERAREGRDRAADAARKGREFVNRQRDQLSQAIEKGRAAYDDARSHSEEPA